MVTITSPLPCMRCRYELLGQPLLASCPECGLAVAASLAASMDHAQRQHTALQRPRLVAAAVLGCACTVLASVALQMGGPMLAVIESLRSQRSAFPDRINLLGWSISAALLLGTALLCHVALRARESLLRVELGRWRTWLLAGAWMWCLAAASGPALAWALPRLMPSIAPALPWIVPALQLPGMATMLSGLHALLAITGRRSSAFTEAAAARQSVRLLNGTAALLVVITLAGLITGRRVVRGPDLADLVEITSRVAAVCLAALLLFGAAYLVANAWWIARSLVLPAERSGETPPSE